MNRMHSALIVLAFVVLATAPVRAEEKVDFDRDIRPILSDNCYACHGPDEESRKGGGDEGLRFDTKDGAFSDLGGYHAIVPGDIEESELVRRILSEDEFEMMPPATHRKKLSKDQKQLLVAWVRQGAEWSGQWAYTPPKRSQPPSVQHADHVQNWIDQFILARLEKQNIQPSPEADQRTLIRRIYFDLTGLPPSSEAVDAFVNDTSESAWDRVVDDLLSSPHFGERLAVYWLDLVRYADTVGYHGDQPVSVSPYRDYVIEAFNSNMPFDQFTREQLGGDLLPEPNREQLIASGYNRLGMMSAEGGVQPKEYLAKYAADRVRNLGSVWLGSTIGCCECHDHKFDPFRTKDFYRLEAFFADIKEKGLYAGAFADGDWGPKVEIKDEILPRLLEPVDQKLADLKLVMETETPQMAQERQEWESGLLSGLTEWHVLEPLEASALHETILAVQDDQSILATGPKGEQNTYVVQAETSLKGITAFRMEVMADKSLPGKGPGRGLGGNFVLTEFTVEAGPTSEPVELKNATATFEQTILGEQHPYGAWKAASAIDGDEKGKTWGWAIAPQTGRGHDFVVETATPIDSPEETVRLTFRMDQNMDLLPDYTIGRFRLSATTASQPIGVDELFKLPDNIQQVLTIPESERSDEQKNELAAHYRTIAPLLGPVRKKIAKLNKERKAIVDKYTRTSLITETVEPREIRVLPRGNWMDASGSVVEPGVPDFLMQISADERANRLDLADWVVSANNPLTARVFVNRLWKLYFGTGLSKVLDDLGSQGETPSHPQLLDTLAMEFVESGWDVKHIVKLIVTSGTYRQSSLPRPELRDVDPYNRLLARQSRYRLDAEFIRDTVLDVSGLLVRKVGGPSVKPYQPDGLYVHLNFPKRTYDSDDGEDQYRRGLYTHWQRQFLHPAMRSFDAPAREECTAERPRSNTPLGALVMLNDPSYVEAARVFASRALREGCSCDVDRVHWIVNRALSRDAQDDEVAVLIDLLQSQRAYYADNEESAKSLVSTGLAPVPEDLDAAELAAWTTLTRAVLNMHEFITRN